MWLLLVVPRKPCGECQMPFFSGRSGKSVDPLPQLGLDESLGLPVGSVFAGTGRSVARSVTLTGSSAKVAGEASAIVGKQSRDRVCTSVHGVEHHVQESRRAYAERVARVLRQCGEILGCVCSKRLVAAIPNLLESLHRHRRLWVAPRVAAFLKPTSAARAR